MMPLAAPVLATLLTANATAAEPPVDTRPAGGRPLERIVFVGDSLVHRAQEDHGLLAQVRAELERRHPALAFEVIDAGVNGNRIADIQRRLQRDVLSLLPAAVVLYWDSDVSDVDESGMKPPEVGALRATYERALDDVLQRLTVSGAHVIVSGPTLLGERPRGHNARDRQLDAYRSLNRHAAALFDVPYVNTRRAFFHRRPFGANTQVSKGLLTEDGEHLNDRGTTVAARAFVRALDVWLKTTAR